MRTSNAVDYTFGEVYKGMNEQVGTNAPLLQSFVLNNNTDIIKAIEYWKSKINGENDENRVRYESHIAAYEDVMLQRLSMTQDLFSTEAPASPITFKLGPATRTEDAVVIEEVIEKKQVKTLTHPASKGKGEKKKITINEKIAEDEERRIKEAEDAASATGVIALPAMKSEYEKKYRTEEARTAALTALIPSLEADIIAGKKDSAMRKLRYHLKNYGEYVKFCEDDQMSSLLYWIERDRFKHLSPFNILLDKKLSIMDLVKEATRLSEAGQTKGQVIDYLRPFVLENQLEEQDEDKIIRTEEEYISFCEQSISFLFKPKDSKSTDKEDKPKENEPSVSRDEIKEQLYEVHKTKGKGQIKAIVTDFREWLALQKQKASLKDVFTEITEFVKSKNQPTTVASKAADSGVETETPEAETTPEETVKVDGEGGETDTSVLKTRFPRLEEQLKFKSTKKELREFLLAIVNKHVKPIGEQKNGMDAKIDGISHLARMAFLDWGVKDHDDWTEQDVSQFMAQEVVPFITDDYAILASNNEEELTENIKGYLKRYPAGKEKERKEALQTVLVSEVPRDNYMKSVAKKVRRGNFNEINAIIYNINKAASAEKKSETKTK